MANNHEKVLVSLPKPLVSELKKFAKVCRKNNKSGFVADAIEAYIAALRKEGKARKLRQSYADSAKDTCVISGEWDKVDIENWDKLL